MSPTRFRRCFSPLTTTLPMANILTVVSPELLRSPLSATATPPLIHPPAFNPHSLSQAVQSN